MEILTVHVLGSTRTIKAGRSAVEGSGPKIIGATRLTLFGEEDLGRMWGPAASPVRRGDGVLWSGRGVGTADESRPTFHVGLFRSAGAWKIDEPWVLLR